MRSLARTAFVVAALPVAATRSRRSGRRFACSKHVPKDSARAASVILITFDRPVAGALDRRSILRRLFKIVAG